MARAQARQRPAGKHGAQEGRTRNYMNKDITSSSGRNGLARQYGPWAGLRVN